MVSNIRSLSSRKFVVYTAPVLDPLKYNVLMDIQNGAVSRDLEHETVTETNAGIKAAFARALAERKISEEEYRKNLDSRYYLTPFSDLEGTGISIKPSGAFKGLNGRFKNNNDVHEALNYPELETLLEQLKADLLPARLKSLKELLRMCCNETERAETIDKHRSTYDFLELESDEDFGSLIDAENQDVFDRYKPLIYNHLYEAQKRRINESAEARELGEATLMSEKDWDVIARSCEQRAENIIQQIKAGSTSILLEDPSDLWMAVVKNLHDDELISPPYRWVVTKENEENIAWITQRHCETLAEQTERPNVLGGSKVNSRRTNSETSDVDLIREIARMPEKDREKTILSPMEIVLVAKAFNEVQKRDAIIEGGNSWEHEYSQFFIHNAEAKKCSAELQALEDSADKSQKELLAKSIKEHKSKAAIHEKAFQEKADPINGWQDDGTRIVPGIEGIEFVRAKDYANAPEQVVIEAKELNGRILRREIQTLGFTTYEKYENNKESTSSKNEPISFLENASKYLPEKSFNREQIAAFVDVYKRSLEYYGKGLKVTNREGKESTLGGYGQISLAVAQIANLSQGSPHAQQLYRCVQEVLNKNITSENIQAELAKMTIKQLEDLRAEFIDRQGVDLTSIEPESAAFGEDGTEYRPTQPHDAFSPINIVNVTVKEGDQEITVPRNRLKIRARRGGFKPVADNPSRVRETRGSLGRASNPFANFYSRNTGLRQYYEYAVNNPVLTPAMKRERAAEEVINTVVGELSAALSHESSIEILFKGLFTPLYMSFVERELFDVYISPIVSQKMGESGVVDICRDQLMIKNGELINLQNINKSSLASLNTKALFDGILKRMGGSLQFDEALKLTPRDDLQIVLNRYSLLRNALEKQDTKDSPFYTETSDRTNYYAGYSNLIDSLEGRLKLLLDVILQKTYWRITHNIENFNTHIEPLKQTIGLKHFWVDFSKALMKGLKIREWVANDMSNAINKPFSAIVASLPQDVADSLMDNQIFADYLLGDEKTLLAVEAGLARKEKFNKIVREFGIKQVKKFVEAAINPLEAQDFWALYPIGHWLLNNEKNTQLKKTAENIFVFPSGVIKVENGELKINPKDSRGKKYNFIGQSDEFVDVFLLQACELLKSEGYTLPQMSSQDKASTQMNLLKDGYSKANIEVIKQVKSLKRTIKDPQELQKQIAEVRFQALVKLEMFSQFIQKRYPIPKERILPASEYTAHEQKLQKLNNPDELFKVLKGMEKCADLCVGEPISSIQDDEFKALVEKYCSDQELFIDLMKYLEYVTEFQSKELMVHQLRTINNKGLSLPNIFNS